MLIIFKTKKHDDDGDDDWVRYNSSLKYNLNSGSIHTKYKMSKF